MGEGGAWTRGKNTNVINRICRRKKRKRGDPLSGKKDESPYYRDRPHYGSECDPFTKGSNLEKAGEQ